VDAPTLVANALDGPIGHLRLLDEARRHLGARLEWLGFGPVRTPCRTLWAEPNARLLAYATAATGPALLIVPAPIKRAYIWDLAPEVSVVRRCLAAGLRVFMLEWTDPEEAARGFGLAHAARTIDTALASVAASSGEHRVFLAGHSLGGTLAAIAATRHPQRIAGLILIEAPLRFGAEDSALMPLMAAAPRRVVRALRRRCVPGALLSAGAATAAPELFLMQPAVDRMASLGSAADFAIHWRVERWLRDELAMSGALFVDIVEQLYRENRFARGVLSLDGVMADPLALSRIPVLAVVEPQSRLVPPDAALGPLAALPAKRRRVLFYAGEPGVALQHVGALVGRAAHHRLWPQILRWISRQRR
jgi:polyhydroxyalkanoate synthase